MQILVAINKFDKRGSLDALRDVKKQYMRNNNLWDIPQDQLPVYGTIASQFNDPGMNNFTSRLWISWLIKQCLISNHYQISEDNV